MEILSARIGLSIHSGEKNRGPGLCVIAGTHGLVFLPPPLCLRFPAGYFGSTCEEKVDPCASSPCQNNATCFVDGVRFSCGCSAGFTGPTCAQLVDFCALSPCAHGTCRSVGTSYKCLCDPGGYRPPPPSLPSANPRDLNFSFASVQTLVLWMCLLVNVK